MKDINIWLISLIGLVMNGGSVFCVPSFHFFFFCLVLFVQLTNVLFCAFCAYIYHPFAYQKRKKVQ